MVKMGLLLAFLAPLAPAEDNPFAIIVMDDQTGRGVPLVELRTVNNIRLVTNEPALQDPV